MEKEINVKGSGMTEQDKEIGSSSSTSSPVTASPHSVTLDPYPSTVDIEKDPSKPQRSPPAEGSAIGRILSKTRSNNNVIDPGPPPDGGLEAWTQVFVGHIIVCNTWGFINTFGSFQTYYLTALPSISPSGISWLGSVQPWLLFFVGTFSGRLADAGYFKHLLWTGTVVLLFGVFMTSLCTEYWQLFLAQGLCTGLGNGILFCPSVAVLSTYWSRRKSFAIGLAAAGSAIGGLIYPAVCEQLLPKIGFPWTVRVLGFIMLSLQAVALALARARLPPRRTGPLVEWSAFKEAPYVLFAIGMFLCFWGLYIAFFYIGSFGIEEFGVTQGDAINLLLVMNGVGIIGRVLGPYCADKFTGPLNIVIPFAVTTCIFTFCWAAVSSAGALWAFAVLYGLSAAGIQSLFPATAVSLTTDLKKAGVRTGMLFTIVSFATLTGPPLAGALIERDGGGYLYTQMFAGATFAAGSLMLLASRVAKTGWKLRYRC